jgi:hypothetical protein
MSEQDQQRRPSPLESERGSTNIEDGVVSRIAGTAAGEVEGVHMAVPRGPLGGPRRRDGNAEPVAGNLRRGRQGRGRGDPDPGPSRGSRIP